MSACCLFRLLTLLLSIFYLDAVCQTDAEDARASTTPKAFRNTARLPTR